MWRPAATPSGAAIFKVSDMRDSVLARSARGVCLAGLALGCGGETSAPRSAIEVIDAAGLAEHVRTLASDEFEGRAPVSDGERKTVEYLRDAFSDLGLSPANDGEWVQAVPLVSITADPDAMLYVDGGSGHELAYGDDFMAWTKRVIDRTALRDSELVFVGYGIVAPEYGWDDYADLDVAGKTVIILVNDPGYATGDERFDGRAMTYYGRWTYKFEEAARQGAEGALIIHDTGPAGYPWEVVSSSWSGPQLGLVAVDANLSRAAVEGWLTRAAADALFEDADLDLDDLMEDAAQPDFEPISLGLTASVEIRNEVERSTSNNVVALVEGSERPEEVVVYMAHWDHLGRDETLEGDQVYNGALDNATGTGGLLEIAEAFAELDPAPARSVLFLAVTAEEKGLLGSAYYTERPIFPLEGTVAAINMDGLNTIGPVRDITVIGSGSSELDDYLEDAASDHGRDVRPDPEPEKGFFFRSDHFNFAKRGVPALYTDGGIDHVEHGPEYGRRMRDEYTAERYHTPRDEYDESWDLDGAVDDLRLLFEIGYRLAQEDTWPNWREGNEFRAARDQMRGDG